MSCAQKVGLASVRGHARASDKAAKVFEISDGLMTFWYVFLLPVRQEFGNCKAVSDRMVEAVLAGAT
jgi:hypothetical protein